MKSFLCLLFFVTVTHGQDAPFGLAADEQDRSEEERDLIADAARQGYRDVLARRFRLEVESMQGHLKLSPVDTKKLHLAAKGAVAGMVKQNSDRLVQGLLRKVKNGTAEEITINGVPLIKEDGAEEEEDDREEAEPIGPNRGGYKVTISVNHVQTWISVRRPNGGGGGTSGGGGLAALLTQDIWVKNRDKVLSKQQQQSFEDYRAKLVRSHLTEILTGQLALKIVLTIEERKKVHGWVEQQIAVLKIDKRSDPVQLAPQLLSRFEYKNLKSILSGDQVEVLKKSASVTRSQFPFGF